MMGGCERGYEEDTRNNRHVPLHFAPPRICLLMDADIIAVELLPMEECDILLHTGDFSMFYNSKRGGRRFIEWFRAQAATYRIMVCGNHDKCLYGRTHDEMKEWAGDDVEILFDSMTSVPLEGFVFEDRGGSSEKEINFYGTPWTIARGYGMVRGSSVS